MLLYGAILKHSKNKQTEQMADLCQALTCGLLFQSQKLAND